MNVQWEKRLADELQTLEKRQQKRALFVTERPYDTWIIRNGKKLLNLASNNYLGLAGDKRLVAASIEATQQYGTGAAASRLITGNYHLYEETEAALAAWKGTEKALLVNSGYTANLGVISALVGRGDIVFSDRLNHASIVDGIILSGAEHKRYKHNDLNHLEKLLQEAPLNKRKLIITDTIFSMDGDLAHLRELIALKEKYGALLMIDEAHAGGIYGKNGAGLAEEYEVSKQVDVHMGTCSKALGCFGAYIAGDALLINYLTNKMRSLIFTTGLPPGVVGAIKKAIEVVQEEPARRNALIAKGKLLRTSLHHAGFNIGESTTYIVPLIIGSNEKTVQFSQRLQQEGIAGIAVRPPTVPEKSSRIRLTVMAIHSESDLQWVIETIIQAGKEEGIIS